MVRLGSIGEIDGLFTDKPPPPAMSDVFKTAEIQVFVASN
jgi:DeoR/GlpR family transcriptional regulator of sugar metabolism